MQFKTVIFDESNSLDRRKYPSDVIDRAVAEYNKRVSSGDAVVTLGDMQHLSELDASNVAAKVTNIESTNGKVVASMQAYGPQADVLTDLVNQGVPLCCRMVGYGSLNEDGSVGDYRVRGISILTEATDAS